MIRCMVKTNGNIFDFEVTESASTYQSSPPTEASFLERIFKISSSSSGLRSIWISSKVYLAESEAKGGGKEDVGS